MSGIETILLPVVAMTVAIITGVVNKWLTKRGNKKLRRDIEAIRQMNTMELVSETTEEEPTLAEILGPRAPTPPLAPKVPTPTHTSLSASLDCRMSVMKLEENNDPFKGL